MNKASWSPDWGREAVSFLFAIVRFLKNSDPGEARHIKRRGSIPSRQVGGKKKDKSIQLLSLPRGEVGRVALTKCHSASSELQVKVNMKPLIEHGIMESRLRRRSWQLHVIIIRFLGSSDPGKLAISNDVAPYPQGRLTTTMYMYGVSKNYSSCCYIIIIAVVAKAVEAISVTLTKFHSKSFELQVKVDMKALIEQGFMESRLGRGSWQLPVAIVRFLGSSDPDEARHIERHGSKAVVAKAVVAPAALAIKKSESAPHLRIPLSSALQEFSSPEDPFLPIFLSPVGRSTAQLPVEIVYFPGSSDPGKARHIERRGSIPSRHVALTKCHSASSDLHLKVDKKALIKQGIIESRLGRGSWQLPIAIVHFPGSSDPGEARHIERRGSIPSRQVRGKKKDKSVQLLSLPRGEVSRVREALVKPTSLFGMYGFVFRLTATMYMYGVSKNSISSVLAKAVVAKVVVAPTALAIKKLESQGGQEGTNEQGIMESRLGRGSWQLPVAIVRFPMSSDPDEAHHIERRGFKATKVGKKKR
ncbi:hypothetical protein Tco_0989561 [Tanacetum coccineum]|uniref:Ribosomal protein S3 n=1 Tax=Tanacetum coccineum TaxID=301880 RepID=A0ABQ5EVH3_9ASTR